MGAAGQAALSTGAMAAMALAAGAMLGAWGLPVLPKGEGTSWALARYEALKDVVFAHLVCLAALAGIVRRVGRPAS